MPGYASITENPKSQQLKIAMVYSHSGSWAPWVKFIISASRRKHTVSRCETSYFYTSLVKVSHMAMRTSRVTIPPRVLKENWKYKWMALMITTPGHVSPVK